MNAAEIIIPTVAGTPFGGGIYAGRFCVAEQTFALIVAPADSGELAETKWGAAKKVAGALSYNDGLANTKAMAAAGSPLAKWAQALRIGDLDDWYVPSRLEALVLFGERDAIGDLVRGWYWTSTQYAGDDAYAWYQYFYYGAQDNHPKYHQLRARAVRRFLIQ